jgi:uncharacterized protein involved in oxidation of intracellular sulfur
MKLLIILSAKPYDSTDIVWNGLRLIKKSIEMGFEVKLFSMNESVELVSNGLVGKESYDLQGMLIESINDGLDIRVCETCLKRAGIDSSKVIQGVKLSVMTDLVKWISECDKIVTF